VSQECSLSERLKNYEEVIFTPFSSELPMFIVLESTKVSTVPASTLPFGEMKFNFFPPAFIVAAGIFFLVSPFFLWGF